MKITIKYGTAWLKEIISSVQDDNKGKKNVKSKSVMTSTQDLKPNTRKSKLDAKRYSHLSSAKGVDNLPYKGVIELPSECIDKSNVQLPDLPSLSVFQEGYETSENTKSSVKTRSFSCVEKTTTSEEQSDDKDSCHFKKKRTSALKSLRENIPDTPFTWDMDEGVDSTQVRDKNNHSIKKSTDKCEGCDHQSGSSLEQKTDNKKHSTDLPSKKSYVDSDLSKKSDSCHDDNISIISDDTKSICSNSDHTDTESAHSGTGSVERIVPKTCSGKHTNKVRHIYHHGKIWNIGKGHVTSVPVHQVEMQEDSMCESSHKSDGSVSLHRHETVLHVIEVDRKHDAGGKHVVGVTEDEEFSEFHTYTSRDASDLKNKTESDDKPAKKWKIEQGKRKNVSKSGATYPYVFKKSRKK
ncbi:hypothetical protein KUTeg_020479 [Tegillarca granosa]|uniref:Uncharacterized protein n=1 Tax=Tegillarca granosa TaxID=220873 RepID=A0ABQ9E851_TEGGR|nr:hypothetical protein KUTeg_020479 [Tegillarca granosa]